MTERPAGTDEDGGHRRFAVDAFNAAWSLIDAPERTPEQDRQMLTLAFAARWHWGEIGTVENTAVSDWQVAHCASLLGDGPLALWFAHAALERVQGPDQPSWLRASMCEGMARAHAAAGDRAGYERFVAQARDLLAQVDDDEDRELIESQLATIPPPG
ncbi:MAG: hypothetical protein QOF18_797 [Frankiaceae bacterium]|nr:hypothetical protein [Frankiaceae bacterium]